MRYTRRHFLQTLGGAGVGLALSSFGFAASEKPEDLHDTWPDRQETWSISICQQCPGGCGIRVRQVGGRPVKIEGNPDHPVNQGRLCPKGQSALHALYDPDRIRTPLLRTGKRGAGAWKPLGWDEALGMLRQRLAGLQAQGEPHRLAILGGQYRGFMDPLWRRFAHAYGTPNYIRLNCLQTDQAMLAHVLSQGAQAPLSFDLRHARLILSFGCNLLETWQSPVHVARAYADTVSAAGGRTARLVQVDPRFSPTAAKADQWVPIEPGRDGALALGLAYVLIRENLYDDQFVRNFTFGFHDWVDDHGVRQRGYRSVVLDTYEPSHVAEITGVPVETIIQLAREFGARKPALAIGSRGVSQYSNDNLSRLAVHSLNALVGNIGQKGGVLGQNVLPFTPWPSFELDGAARRGVAMPRVDGAGQGRYLLSTDAFQALPQNLKADKPYSIDTLLIYGTNPLLSHPSGAGFSGVLDHVGFVVSFSPYYDETAMMADLVLPDHTPLERWLDDPLTQLAGFSAFSIAPPVVSPLFETRSTGDVVLRLAAMLGGVPALALPWKSYEDLLRFSARGLFEAGFGHVISIPEREGFRQLLRQRGYWRRELATFDDFWKALVSRGAWWDAEENYGALAMVLHTPSRRYEFYSQTLRRQVEEEARKLAEREKGLDVGAAVKRLAGELHLGQNEQLFYLPHYEEPSFRGEDRSYPLHFGSYKLMSRYGGRTGNQPWLQEHPAAFIESDWDPWVEINPVTARRLNIQDGEWVWVESSKGRLRAKARLYPGTRPNMVNMATGAGHTAMGRWAQGVGANPNEVILPGSDVVRGFGTLGETRVRIVKL
ncbi:MAG: molybdopterin-dependent oxidoreductase [Candidatus Tectomicrobia bacterium]|nr:molybdopterin-dependent oxidoreductase [Candidatus Tectomicrobia bacterium]